MRLRATSRSSLVLTCDAFHRKMRNEGGPDGVPGGGVMLQPGRAVKAVARLRHGGLMSKSLCCQCDGCFLLRGLSERA
ncbi:MAG TPA: hypothetical protein DEF41_13190 [Desulfovibrio sp.]|nr:hypothetical protein [Desulfovibrio sp.]